MVEADVSGEGPDYTPLSKQLPCQSYQALRKDLLSLLHVFKRLLFKRNILTGVGEKEDKRNTLGLCPKITCKNKQQMEYTGM